MKDKINKNMKYLIIIGIVLIPIMYSFFYLKAFWNPYDNLQGLKVAIVNNDRGYNRENKGSELIKTLQDKDIITLQELNQTQANEGLTNQKYYALILIPESFSEDLLATNKRQTTTTITYSPNQKYNYLASQIISKILMQVELDLKGEINKNIVSTLTSKLDSVPSSLSKISNASNDIKQGTSKLNIASNQLLTGVKEINNGVSQISAGSNELANKANSLPTLTAASNSISQNNNLLNQNIESYINQVNLVLSLYNTDGRFNTLISSGNALKYQNNQLNLGIKDFNQNAQSLNDLNPGIQTLNMSLKDLNQGTQKLQTGTLQFNNGVSELNEGAIKFNHEINDNLTIAKSDIKKLDGLSDYAQKPVTIKEKDYAKVTSYGIGFAPYFMSLSLWVGVLMIFVGLYYDPENRFKVLGKHTNNRLYRILGYTIIAIIQAMILGSLLKLGLGFSVDNIWLYYASCILISIVFLSIIQFFIINLGDVGKFLSILILVIQLAASAGTFPIETTPMIFQKLYPYMPMNYSIKLFKESLIESSFNVFINNSVTLLLIASCFIAGSLLWTTLKKHKTKVV